MVMLAVTLAMGSPAVAQTPQDPSHQLPAETASEPDQTPAGAPARKAAHLDGRELEAFMDGYFARQLEEEKIPGATVSVVKDGEVLFAKGYGRQTSRKTSPSSPTRRSSG